MPSGPKRAVANSLIMTIRRLFPLLFLLALFTIAVRETADPDLWWHLRTGQWIWEQGIPRVDPFSYTRLGERWITHEWLSEAIMWGVYQIGGLPGLSLTFAAIIAAAFWLLYRASPGQPYLAAFITLLAAITSAPTWEARPQMFNLLFLALFVYQVEHYRTGTSSARALLWLIPLTALWANLHSGYQLGVVVLGGYALGEMGQRLIHQRWPQIQFTPGLTQWGQIRPLVLITGGSFLAAAFNPNGFRLWIYPFETLRSPAMQQYIKEWQSPDFHLWDFRIFALMLGLGVLAWVWSGTKPHLAELILWGGGAAAGLTSARNIPLFAVVASPIIIRHMLLASQGQPFYALLAGTSPEPTLSRLLRQLNWLILVLVILAASIWVGRRLNNIEPLIEQLYPIAAVAYLEEHGLTDQRIFNDYSFGGYLIWRGLPVFADGRADVYGDAFLFYYLQTYLARANWQEPLDTWDVDVVLMSQGTALTSLLTASPAWEQVYADDVAQIFVRR